MLLRELRALCYPGGYSILKDHLATLGGSRGTAAMGLSPLQNEATDRSGLKYAPFDCLETRP